ncbi:hypothetical protein [Paenibacillus kobensis]|uniref:hypothetical protein n=1 Tax=Paenibacillus kobensis TaxID=59841 RepID=UPI000FD74CEA|nr:hypothetical protein [Paenibacillus kobensis]
MNQMTRTMARRSRTMRTVAASLLLAALMTTAACGAESKSSGNDSPASTGVVEETANGSGETGAIDTGTATPESGGSSASETNKDEPAGSESTSSNEPAPKQTEGNFNGLADSHSAEITTSEGVFVYQLNEEVEAQAAALEENAKIRFEYIEKAIDGGETQRWLVKIEAE